jgi:hypothetical protein
MAITCRRGILAAGLLGPLLGASVAIAQIPDKFTNLQVLPKDVAKRELVAAMRGIASDLGVRCAHCHVGPDNLELDPEQPAASWGMQQLDAPKAP